MRRRMMTTAVVLLLAAGAATAATVDGRLAYVAADPRKHCLKNWFSKQFFTF